MVCENILVNADQILTKESVFIVEVTKPELPIIQSMVIHIKHGKGSTENGTVITVIVNLKQHQSNRNERMQIDSNTKGNMLESNKKEQVDVHGALIIFLMVHANIHNFIISVNILMMIQWLILSNYV